MKKLPIFLAIILALSFVGCSSVPPPAPVPESSFIQPAISAIVEESKAVEPVSSELTKPEVEETSIYNSNGFIVPHEDFISVFNTNEVVQLPEAVYLKEDNQYIYTFENGVKLGLLMRGDFIETVLINATPGVMEQYETTETSIIYSFMALGGLSEEDALMLYIDAATKAFERPNKLTPSNSDLFKCAITSDENNLIYIFEIDVNRS